MAEHIIEIPQPAGGISRQPAAERFKHQVEDALNVVFDLKNGFYTRPGTRHVAVISGLEIENDHRIHMIDRDGVERYVLIYGKGAAGTTIRVFDTEGNEATINVIDSEAQDYLDENDPVADQIIPFTVQDVTFLVNKTVAVGTGTSPTFVVSGSYKNFDVMVCHAPALNSYWEAEETSGPNLLGFYQHIINGTHFASWTKNTQNDVGWRAYGGKYNNALRNPMGFTAVVVRQEIDDAGCTFDFEDAGHSNAPTISGVNTFIDYDYQAGDWLWVVTDSLELDGWYEIAERLDDGTVRLEDVGDVAAATMDDNAHVYGIIRKGEANASMLTGCEDMDDVALKLHDSIQSDLPGALVGWDETNTKFIFVSPYRGTGRQVVGFEPPATGHDLTAVDDDGDNRPFRFSTGTATEGSGSYTPLDDDTYPIEDRWIPVAAPGQVDAVIDAEKMPVKLTRTSISPLEFDLELIEWNDRTSGDAVTNPSPSIFQKGATIADIGFDRNRLVLAGDSNVVYSQSGDLFNFFNTDSTNVVASDPIDRDIGSRGVALVDYIEQFDKSLVVTTKNGLVYDGNAPETLSTETLQFTYATSFTPVGIRPAALGNRLYLPGLENEGAVLLEYFYREDVVSKEDDDVSEHVRGLISTDMKTMVKDDQQKLIVILTTLGTELIVFQTRRQGGRRLQEAFTRFQIESTRPIEDIGIMGGELWMLVQHPGPLLEFTLEWMPLSREPIPATMLYEPHMDARRELTGVHSMGVTTWALGYTDNTIDRVVLGPNFGATRGTVLNATSSGGNVTVPGDYSGEPCYVGRQYDSWVKLSQPMVRNRDGESLIDARGVGNTQFVRLDINHEMTGALEVRAVMDNCPDQGEGFETAVTESMRTGTFGVFIAGAVKDLEVFIENNTVKPMTVSHIKETLDFEPRRH